MKILSFKQNIFVGIILLSLFSCEQKPNVQQQNSTNKQDSAKEEQKDATNQFKTYKITRKYEFYMDGEVTEETDNEQEKPISAHKSVDIQWPVSLNGVEKLSVLQDHLILLMFGKSSPDIETALTSFWRKHPAASGPYDPSETITLTLNNCKNPNFIQFLLKLKTDLGGGTSMSIIRNTQIITYDKRIQKILHNKDILKNPHSIQLLRLINQEIERIEQADEEEYGRPKKMPNNIFVGDQGLTFVCTDCMLFNYQGNELKVFIPYFRLENYLTKEFKTSIE